MAGHQAQFDWSLLGRTCISNLDNTGDCHCFFFLYISLPEIEDGSPNISYLLIAFFLNASFKIEF